MPLVCSPRVRRCMASAEARPCPKRSVERGIMKQKITYWKEPDGRYLGYLNDYPDYWTQGESLDDLKEHLQDLYKEFQREDIPGIRKVAEIEVG